jgi:hypothetical protein
MSSQMLGARHYCGLARNDAVYLKGMIALTGIDGRQARSKPLVE